MRRRSSRGRVNTSQAGSGAPTQRPAPSGGRSTLNRPMSTQPQLDPAQAALDAAAPASASTSGRQSVRDLADGQEVAGSFCVRERQLRQKRNGEDFLKLIVADRTGTVEAVAWDAVDECFECCAPGCVVFIEGRFSIHAQYGAKITIKAIRAAADGEYSHDELAEGPPVSVGQLEAQLRELLGTIQNPQLSQLLDRIFGPDSRLWKRFREAPAAKYYHQAYPHGLLDHTVSVAQAVSAAAAAFPGVDRDVAVTGALLHDIGKTQAYNDDPLAIDLTDAGRLQGEIPLGYYRIRREIEDLPGFPPDTAQAVLHIILSHHGSLAHGSPVVPCTREATLVHHIDNLGGRLGSFDRLEKELAPGQSWTSYDRGIGSSAYFGPAVEAERRAA